MLHNRMNGYFYKSIVISITLSLFFPFGTYALQEESTDVAELNGGTQSKSITNISTSEDKESISIAITCHAQSNFMSVKQAFPPELTLYFPETSLKVSKTEYAINNTIIDSIEASEHVDIGRS